MSKCEDYIKQFVGDKLTDEQINNIYKKYDSVRLEFVTKGLTDNIDKRIADRLARDALDKKYNTLVAKRAAIINRGKFNDIKVMIGNNRATGFTAAKTLRMAIEGIQTSIAGSRTHVDNLKNAYARKWTGGMFADIVKEVPSFFKQFKDPKFDEAIGREMGELKEGGSPGSSGNTDAMKAAKIIQRWKQASRLDYNKRGGMMGEIEGHVAQSHDDRLMIKAGVSKWVNHMYDNLDLEKTFRGIDAINEKEIKLILARSYHQITTGIKFSTEDIAPVSQGNSSSLVTRFSHDRVFHFKDHATQMDYHKQYGHGSITGSVIHGMERLASAVGMMDTFGTNPEVTFKHIVASETAHLAKQITEAKTPEDIAKWEKELKELNAGDLHSMMNEMTGIANVPARASLAKVFGTIRGLMTMANMGGTGLTSAIGDSFNMISTSAYSGQKGFDALAPVLRAFESIPKADRQEAAFRLGEGYQGYIGSIYAQTVDTGSVPGMMSKTLEQYFKWNGVTGWTNHSRQAFVRERSAWLGKNSEKTYDQLNPALREGLLRNGIQETEWEAIRNSGIVASNNNNYIMPDNVRMSDEKHIIGIAAPEIHNALVAANLDQAKTPETRAKREAAFYKKKAEIIDKTRDQLEMKLRTYFYDETNYGIVMPNAKSRRLSRLAIMGSTGAEAGSVLGEIAKSVAMYKSFTIANFDNMGRALQSGNGFQIAGQGIGVLAKLIAVNYVGGLVLTYAQDMAKGNWPPKNPLSFDVLSRAAVSGGALGLYGDYLMSSIHNYHEGAGLVTSLAGPEIGTVADLMYTPFAMFDKDGKMKKTGKLDEVIKRVLDFTPYGNLVVVKPTVDALVLDQLREYSSPGYKKKKAARLLEKNQFNIFSSAAKAAYGR